MGEEAGRRETAAEATPVRYSQLGQDLQYLYNYSNIKQQKLPNIVTVDRISRTVSRRYRYI